MTMTRMMTLPKAMTMVPNGGTMELQLDAVLYGARYTPRLEKIHP